MWLGRIMNLLVIDPDPQTNAQVQRLLGERGDVTIESAQSGTDAWMILGNFRHHFDAVVLELALPDIDGVELLTRMRRSPKHRDLSVLVCSAQLRREVAARVIALGVRHFIVKPAPDELLLTKLGEMTGGRAGVSVKKV